nr:uncharacterized protein LOC115256955 [Aedes albopictus]
MQKRGTPINRLPIMAKSVLDLYELYNLGDRPRWPRGRDQQEALAGDHQGTASAVEHNQRGLHAEDTVSFVYFVLSLSLALHFMSFGNVTGWLRPMNGVDKFRVAVVDTQPD